MSISAKYGQSKMIVKLGPIKVVNFKNFANLVEVENIYHATGWRLIIVIDNDLITDSHYFKFYYGDSKWGFKLHNEFLQYQECKYIFHDAVAKIRKETDMAKDAKIIFEVSDSTNEDIKAWSKQFGKLKEAYELAGQSMSNLAKALEVDQKPLVKPESLSSLAKQLPGVRAKVKLPCDCKKEDSTALLITAVMHLNDVDKWSRERIADWLETLPDEIDITFKTPEKEIV